MAQLTVLRGTIIEGSGIVPAGKQVLWRDDEPIWCGPLGAPIEDAEFDRITVNPQDYERFVLTTMDSGRVTR